MSARPNPQLWYTSSAGLARSVHLRSVRDRGRAGDDPSLCYLEWCAKQRPDGSVDLDDREEWARANPAMGIRVSEEFVANERRIFDDDGFARERLGVWDEATAGVVLPLDAWQARTRDGAQLVGAPTFCLDVNPERSWAAIAAAGDGTEGPMVEVALYRRGVTWVVDELARMCREHGAAEVAVEAGGPAGSLIRDLEDAGVNVVSMSGRDMTAACGMFHDDISTDGAGLVHRPDEALDLALAGAVKRQDGDAWRLGRRSSSVDICPLVASIGAWWLWRTRGSFEPGIAWA
jgi:hypothetical protein